MSIPIGQSVAVGHPFIDLTPEITAAILRTICDGWAIARQNREVHSGAMEVPMTECLRDGMRLALKCLPWRKTLLIAPGTESRSSDEMLIPDGRTDIPLYVWLIFTQSEDHNPHAIIECKRVAESDSYLVREYIVEGVDRFKTGKYGGNHSKGFMAGYILSGTPAGVVAGINAYLGKHKRDAEKLATPSFAGCGLTWMSRHSRSDAMKPIDLHHAMLEIQHSDTASAC